MLLLFAGIYHECLFPEPFLLIQSVNLPFLARSGPAAGQADMSDRSLRVVTSLVFNSDEGQEGVWSGCTVSGNAFPQSVAEHLHLTVSPISQPLTLFPYCMTWLVFVCDFTILNCFSRVSFLRSSCRCGRQNQSGKFPFSQSFLSKQASWEKGLNFI